MGDIDFKVISAHENSNKFQKTRFWKEKSVENVATLGPTAEATLDPMKSSSLFVEQWEARNPFHVAIATGTMQVQAMSRMCLCE